MKNNPIIGFVGLLSLVLGIMILVYSIVIIVQFSIERPKTKYLIIDNITKQEWICEEIPEIYNGNTIFKTSKDEGVIIHGSVTFKKID